MPNKPSRSLPSELKGDKPFSLSDVWAAWQNSQNALEEYNNSDPGIREYREHLALDAWRASGGMENAWKGFIPTAPPLPKVAPYNQDQVRELLNKMKTPIGAQDVLSPAIAEIFSLTPFGAIASSLAQIANNPKEGILNIATSPPVVPGGPEAAKLTSLVDKIKNRLTRGDLMRSSENPKLRAIFGGGKVPAKEIESTGAKVFQAAEDASKPKSVLTGAFSKLTPEQTGHLWEMNAAGTDILYTTLQDQLKKQARRHNWPISEDVLDNITDEAVARLLSKGRTPKNIEDFESLVSAHQRGIVKHYLDEQRSLGALDQESFSGLDGAIDPRVETEASRAAGKAAAPSKSAEDSARMALEQETVDAAEEKLKGIRTMMVFNAHKQGLSSQALAKGKYFSWGKDAKGKKIFYTQPEIESVIEAHGKNLQYQIATGRDREHDIAAMILRLKDRKGYKTNTLNNIRQVLERRLIYRMSTRNIASIMGIDRSNVKDYLARGVAQLRELGDIDLSLLE